MMQPATLRSEEVFTELANLNPDLIVVAAYGQILPKNILELPPHGCINLHASLLPRWRGAAPIQAAILEGDEKSGVTIMKMDAGLDTGMILKQRSTPIDAAETGGELETRLSKLGSELLIETIPAYVSDEIVPAPQDESQATYAPMLKKKDGLIDPAIQAERLARQVRAFEPWPTSFLFWNDLRIVVRSAWARSQTTGAIGTIGNLEGQPVINTSVGVLVLETIQPAGKRAMKATDFLNGAPDFIGSNISR
jgi:methionyl-tRNA formyltransferase